MERHKARDIDEVAILVVGNDMLIEALPARPIQLAHACRRAGFDLVLPLSWGDELIAEAAVGELERRAPSPAVFCACPLVRQRLLAHGPELAPAMVSFVSPPIALSRQLRAALGRRLRSLVFAGRCPSARAPDYDMSLDPSELLAMISERGIDLERQPDVFVDTIPPDRRRYASNPGGSPTPDQLWRRCNERVLVDLEGSEFSADLGQLLLASQSLLVDVAPALGCACSGVTTSTAGRQARIAVTSLEPPRAPAPVMEVAAGIQLTFEGGGRITGTTSAADPWPSADVPLSESARPDDSARRRPPLAVTPPGAYTIPSEHTANGSQEV